MHGHASDQTPRKSPWSEVRVSLVVSPPHVEVKATTIREDHDKVKKTRLGRDNDCEKGTRRENCRVLRRDPTSAKRDANPNFTSDPQISFGLKLVLE